jgi:hypothetical protein
MMNVGDMVKIKTGSGCFEDGEDETCYWPDSKGQIGMIIALTTRLYIPAAKIMVLGEVVEFDLGELEAINESC